MKTLLILSAVLCVALSIKTASSATVPAEAAAAVGQAEARAHVPEVEAETAVGAETAAPLPQARLDFCLDGWENFRGNCFRLFNFPDTWRNAENYCANFEGSLASAHSIWEYHFLQRLAKTGGHAFVWMGGYYFQGDWRWEGGTLFNYNNWDFPCSNTNNHQCLQLNSQDSKGWSNNACDIQRPFICQMRSSC